MRIIYVLVFIIAFSIPALTQSVYHDWSYTIGTSTSDFAMDIIADPMGNVYTLGYFFQTLELEAQTGNIQLDHFGQTDVFLVKHNSSGELVWAKSFVGPDYDYGNSLALDAEHNIIVTGYFRGDIDLDPGPAEHLINSSGDMDIFLVKLNPAGAFLWGRNYGGAGRDYPSEVIVDANDNLYITGGFANQINFNPLGSDGLFSASSFVEGFLLKLTPTGDFIWAKPFLGPDLSYGTQIATDIAGNIYCTGLFFISVNLDYGASNVLSSSPNGFAAIFLAKYDSSGDYIWHKKFDSINSDFPQDLKIDSDGNMYLVGLFGEIMDIDPGAGAQYISAPVGNSTFLIKLDTAANLDWGTAFENQIWQNEISIEIAPNGGLYVFTDFTGTIDLDPGPATALLSTAEQDCYLQKLDDSGNLEWYISYPGSGEKHANGLAVGPHGEIYCAGNFTQDIDLDPGTPQLTANSLGSTDVFIQQLSICPDPMVDLEQDTLMVNLSVAAYQWLDCNDNFNPIPGATGQTYLASSNGSYAVQVTDGICVDTSECQIISTVGIGDFSNLPGFSVYPNPTEGQVTIDLGTTTESLTLYIRDIQGRTLFTKNYARQNKIEYWLDYPAGLYFLELSMKDKREYFSVIKK